MEKRGTSSLLLIEVLTVVILIVIILIFTFLVKIYLSQELQTVQSKISAISNLNLKISQVSLKQGKLLVQIKNIGTQEISSLIARVTSSDNEQKEVDIRENLLTGQTKTLELEQVFGNNIMDYKSVEIIPKYIFKQEEKKAEIKKAVYSAQGGGRGGSSSGEISISDGSVLPVIADLSPIFSFFAIVGPQSVSDEADFYSLINLLNKSGANYIALNARWTQPKYFSELRSRGYKTILGTASGYYEDEIYNGVDNLKFINASCIDRTRCENWNSSAYNLNPAYTGILWQNTLSHLKDWTNNTHPDIVDFDSEFFSYYRAISMSFLNGDPGKDCNCDAVSGDSRLGSSDAYVSAWIQRGKDFDNAVKEVNSSIKTLFFDQVNNWPPLKFYLKSTGEIAQWEDAYWINGTADISAPSLYCLPNTEVLMMNSDAGVISNTVPYLSFDFTTPYSSIAPGYGSNTGFIFFDPSVSKLAGKILRKGGARGAIIYPGPHDVKETLLKQKNVFYSGTPIENRLLREYWLNHMSNLTAGYYDTSPFSENDLLNGDFEEFSALIFGISNNESIVSRTRFIPVYWNFSDTNTSYYSKSAVPLIYPGLTYSESHSGMVSWQHKRFGDLGNRTIFRNFTAVSSRNAGISLWIKSNAEHSAEVMLRVIDSDGIIISDANKTVTTQWTQIQNNASLTKDETYVVKIVLEYLNNNAEVYIDDFEVQ